MNVDIKHVAKLAKLRINDDELSRFESEMSDIIGMVESMPEINDEWLLDEQNAMELRKDELADKKLSRDQVLKNAPKVVAGCVVVPKTVD